LNPVIRGLMSLHVNIGTSNPAHQSLIADYWATDEEGKWRETVAEIARRHGIPVREVSQRVGELASAYDPEFVCPSCHTPIRFRTRSDFQQSRGRWQQGPCAACNAAAKALAETERQRAAEEFRQRVQAEYAVPRSVPLDMEDLALETAVYLAALARLSAKEDLLLCEPPHTSPAAYAPNQSMRYDALVHLFHERLITPDPVASPLDAFTERENGRIAFYPDRVWWRLQIGKTAGERAQSLRALERAIQEDDLYLRWDLVQVAELWLRVAKAEVFAYLDLCMRERGLEHQPGEKTELLVEFLLRQFSIGQIARLIYSAAAAALDFGVRKGLTKKHTANVVISNLQRRAERALADGWSLEPFSRNYDLPVSAVAEVFFYSGLKITDIWSTRMPPELQEMLEDRPAP
jgi:hypothetical protein